MIDSSDTLSTAKHWMLQWWWDSTLCT